MVHNPLSLALKGAVLKFYVTERCQGRYAVFPTEILGATAPTLDKGEALMLPTGSDRKTPFFGLPMRRAVFAPCSSEAVTSIGDVEGGREFSAGRGGGPEREKRDYRE